MRVYATGLMRPHYYKCWIEPACFSSHWSVRVATDSTSAHLAGSTPFLAQPPEIVTGALIGVLQNGLCSWHHGCLRASVAAHPGNR